jgi:hypothetical protein
MTSIDTCNNPPGTTDDLTYTLTTGGATDTAVVAVTVACVNDPPIVVAPGPFNVIGNVGISVPDGASDLLAGVTDPADGAGTLPFAVSQSLIITGNGGSVSINQVTGAFTYNPAPGFEGSDSFLYTVCDNGVPGSACTNATVNLTVADVIWFIDNSAGVQGDGRLNSPFNSLDGAGGYNANAADQIDDIIFLFTGSGNYTGGITLLNRIFSVSARAGASLRA